MNKFIISNKSNIIINNKIISNIYNNEIEYKILEKICYEKIDTIAIFMTRNEFLLQSILVCLKIRLPYIPIDLNNPDQRIENIMRNSKTKFVITEKKLQNRLSKYNTIVIDEILNKKIKINFANIKLIQSPIAYIIYTSGSTGMPKGVEIYRESLINFIEGVQEILHFKTTNRIACLTTPAFDIFFLESIMALYLGMTVVMADDKVSENPRMTAKWIVENKIDIIQMTPTKLQQIYYIDPKFDCLSNVKKILVGGENLPLVLLKCLQKNTNAKIYNMYGPTETTIWSSIADLTKSETIHIGTPIKKTKFHIKSESFNNKINNKKGELYISGKGLAKGYLFDAKKTNESFIYDPVIKDRLYRTGDIVKINKCGNYEYIGRIDNQIKLRGHRIELEEIESTINRYENIFGSLVFLENNMSLSVLYKSSVEISEDDIIKFLLKELPAYMVPKKFNKISNFVYTANNKVNREITIQQFMRSL